MFLTTLSLSLSQSYNCQTFTNPSEALRHINKNYTDTQPNRQPEKASLRKALKKTTSFGEQHKYNELSVVVVDYDMPGIDGIEFCAQLNNPFIRKVLLTGCASSNVVFKAFNDNIIDYYLDKQTDNLLNRVDEVVAEMQKAYFREHLQSLSIDVIKNEAPCFLDSALADFFDDILKQLNVDEYYYSPEKSHFILHSGNKSSILITLDDEKMEEHMQIIEDEDGPEEWIEKLSTRQYVPYFDSNDGFYTPESQVNKNPLLKSTIIRGKKNYYCALLSDHDFDLSPFHWKDHKSQLH